MRRIPAIVLLLITSIGLAALIACQTIPGAPATATTPATPSTVSLTPGATVAIGNVEAIAAAIGASQPGTPWGSIASLVSGALALALGAFGTGHSVGNASGVASAQPAAAPIGTTPPAKTS